MTMDEQLIRAMGDKLREAFLELEEIKATRRANGEKDKALADREETLRKLRNGLIDSLYALGSSIPDSSDVG